MKNTMCVTINANGGVSPILYRTGDKKYGPTIDKTNTIRKYKLTLNIGFILLLPSKTSNLKFHINLSLVH